jgi:hypothetical protein
MARQLSRFGLASVERIAAAAIATSVASDSLLEPAEKEDKTTMLKILFA